MQVIRVNESTPVLEVFYEEHAGGSKGRGRFPLLRETWLHLRTYFYISHIPVRDHGYLFYLLLLFSLRTFLRNLPYIHIYKHIPAPLGFIIVTVGTKMQMQQQSVRRQISKLPAAICVVHCCCVFCLIFKLFDDTIGSWRLVNLNKHAILRL